MLEMRTKKTVIDSLLSIAKTKLIISIKDDDVCVGPYTITPEKTKFVLKIHKIELHKFNSKKAAIAYAISEYNHSTLQSKIIKMCDVKMEKYINDIIFYKRSLDIAEKSNNIIRQNIIQTRLECAYNDLERIKFGLMEEIKKVKIA